MKEKIVSDLRYFFIDMFIVSVIGYLFYILMGRMLDPTQYGIVMTVIGLFTILSPLTSIGFNEALARFVPMVGNGKSKVYVFYALKKAFLVTILFSVALVLFSGYIADVVYSNSAMQFPLLLLAPMIIFGTFFLVLKGALQGMKKFLTILWLDFVSQIFRIIIPFFLVMYGFGVAGALYGWIFSFFIFTVVGLFYMSSYYRNKQTVEIKQDFLKFGASSALFAASLWLLIQSGLLFLGLYNIEQAGLFSVAVVFGQMLLSLPMIVIGVLLPYLSEMFSKNKLVSARRLVEISLKDLFILMFPFSIFVAFFSKQMIYHIYTPEYVSASQYFLPTMFAFMLLGLNLILMIVLYSAGRHFDRLKYVITMSMMNLGFIVLLYHFFSSMGVAYGYLITQIITLAYLSFACNRKLKITFPRKIFNSIPAVVVFSILIYLIDIYYINFEYGIIFVGIAGLIYLGLLYAFKTFDKDDFDLVKLILKL